jgi:hypothetical protein
MSSFIINSNTNASAKSAFISVKELWGARVWRKLTEGVMPKSSGTTDFEF